jgi:hypothetical protein
MIIPWRRRGGQYIDTGGVRVLYGRVVAIVQHKPIRVVSSISMDDIATGSRLDVATSTRVSEVAVGTEVD